MNHIIITESQANQLRGDYGDIRGSDNQPTARIEPIKTPDGKYTIPESVIGGFGLEEIEDDIIDMITPTNIKNIIDLPAVGGLCEKDHLYNYYEVGANAYSGLVKCVQTHNRTIYPPIQTPALFSFFRENSDTLDWIQNEWVEVGWKRIYNGLQYEVIQAHQTLITWTPDVTPALWRLVAPPTQEWTYPVAYAVNQIVTYQGSTYKCLQAHTSQANWYPPNVPALWQLQP